MQQIKQKALVIREVDFGEQDRYITVLTEGGRRLEVLCKGTRRKNARGANAARLFCWSELDLFENRGRYSLDDAALLHSFWEITQELEGYALACYCAELAAAMSDDGEETPALPRLLLNALYALTEQHRPPPLVKAAFELRLMAESGFAPQLAPCAFCGAPTDEGAWFSVRGGVAACPRCAERLPDDRRPLGAGTFAALRHILSCDLKRLYAFALGEESLRALGHLCEQYALFYAERGFDSLKFYHSLTKLPTAKPKKREKAED